MYGVYFFACLRTLCVLSCFHVCTLRISTPVFVHILKQEALSLLKASPPSNFMHFLLSLQFIFQVFVCLRILIMQWLWSELLKCINNSLALQSRGWCFCRLVLGCICQHLLWSPCMLHTLSQIVSRLQLLYRHKSVWELGTI